MDGVSAKGADRGKGRDGSFDGKGGREEVIKEGQEEYLGRAASSACVCVCVSASLLTLPHHRITLVSLCLVPL